MHRSFLVFTMAFVALMAGALFYAAQAPLKNAPEPAMAAPVAKEFVSHPSFSLPDITGTPRDFSEWQGRHRLLNFWATWCAPCRREIPLLKAFHESQGETGVMVIGIAVDFPEEVARYAEDAKFNYPVLVGEQDAMAVAESSGIDFIGLPFTMIVAADGELLNAHIGEIHQQDLDHIATVLKRMDAGDLDRAAAIAELDGL